MDSYTECTLEEISSSDPFPARAAAILSASPRGVPIEVLIALREQPVGEHRSVDEWLHIAQDQASRWDDSCL